MDKVILLLFAVFAVFQVQAAPELYNRLYRDEALRDFFEELENQPRERVNDDLYSSVLNRRDSCVDEVRTCYQFEYQCAWSARNFHEASNLNVLLKKCCRTCRRYHLKKK